MGKSDKKVKSDRINAIRKQYDAFLEDDKKRKERNEYILEKLDKMRYCTALVPVRQKAPICIDSRKVSLYNMPKQPLDSPVGLTQINVNTRQGVDESILLQEISKKYILIPKIRAHGNDYSSKINPQTEENTDWKSKYEILNQLKRDEKEQGGPAERDATVLKPGHNVSNMNYEYKNDIHDEEPLLEYKNELPVKLPPDDQTPYEIQQQYTADNAVIDHNFSYNSPIDDPTKINNVTDAIYCENSMQNIVYDGNNDQNMVYDDVDNVNINYRQENPDNQDYDQIPSKDNTDYLKTNIQEDYTKDNDDVTIADSIPQIGTNQIENADTLGAQSDNEYLNDQHESIISASHEDSVTKEEPNNNIVNINNQTRLDQNHFVNTVNAKEITNDLNNAMSESDATIVDNNSDYPIETVNVEEFTPHDGVELVDGVNINPEPQVLVANSDLTHHYDPAVEPDNIHLNDEISAQQNEYTEQQENYDYTEEGVTENYNAEYSQPTENYPQDENYTYYEGAQAEQPYTEVNENEETLQQYDQTYEEQYGTTYDQQAYQHQGYEQEYPQGYEQHGYTEPQQQQYETVDQTQQGLHYENQDNVTPQYVEEQLDREEGYVQNTDDKIEERHVENVAELQQVSGIADQEAKVQ